MAKFIVFMLTAARQYWRASEPVRGFAFIVESENFVILSGDLTAASLRSVAGKMLDAATIGLEQPKAAQAKQEEGK